MQLTGYTRFHCCIIGVFILVLFALFRNNTESTDGREVVEKKVGHGRVKDKLRCERKINLLDFKKNNYITEQSDGKSCRVPFMTAIRNSKPQLSPTQMTWIASTISSYGSNNGLNPFNILVWGLGFDSQLWYTAHCDAVHQKGGHAIFVENWKTWIDTVGATYPHLEVYEFGDYKSKVEEYRKFFDNPYKSITLAPEVEDKCFDMILIDAPQGYNTGQPGRQEATWWSIQKALDCLRNGHPRDITIFLHDLERNAEQTLYKDWLAQYGEFVGTWQGPFGILGAVKIRKSKLELLDRKETFFATYVSGIPRDNAANHCEYNYNTLETKNGRDSDRNYCRPDYVNMIRELQPSQISKTHLTWISTAISVYGDDNGNIPSNVLIWGLSEQAQLLYSVHCNAVTKKKGTLAFISSSSSAVSKLKSKDLLMESYLFNDYKAPTDFTFEPYKSITLNDSIEGKCWDVIVLDTTNGDPKKVSYEESLWWSIEKTKECLKNGHPREITIFVIHQSGKGIFGEWLVNHGTSLGSWIGENGLVLHGAKFKLPLETQNLVELDENNHNSGLKK